MQYSATGVLSLYTVVYYSVYFMYYRQCILSLYRWSIICCVSQCILHVFLRYIDSVYLIVYNDPTK